jgi:hypothetical protein
MLKSALMVPSNSMYGINHDRKILDSILYVVYNSDIPRQLIHSALSPFL